MAAGAADGVDRLAAQLLSELLEFLGCQVAKGCRVGHAVKYRRGGGIMADVGHVYL